MTSGSSGGGTGSIQEVWYTPDTIEIVVACDACGATGLYRGFAEPEWVAVICLKCDGVGNRVLKFKRYKHRRLRDDVRTVMRSKGSFIATGIGPDESQLPMTYEEFLRSIPVVTQ